MLSTPPSSQLRPGRQGWDRAIGVLLGLSPTSAIFAPKLESGQASLALQTAEEAEVPRGISELWFCELSEAGLA